MTIDVLIFVAAGLVIFVALQIGIRANKRCSDLEHDVNQLLYSSRKNADIAAQLMNRMQSLTEYIEEVEDERQARMTNISTIFEETKLKIDNLQCFVENHLNAFCTLVQSEKEKRISAVEWWADKAELADIVEPENNDANSDEAPIYRWIFPAEEPDHEKRLIYGQRYTVIGVSKKPEITGIITYEGFWEGHDFITTDNYVFDTVYAYIRKPEPADVMKKVVQMALAGKR